MAFVYLGLGSNLGDRIQNIHSALDLLSRYTSLLRVSSIYETEPVGFLDQPKFLNAACQIKTSLCPFQLLVLTKGIEVSLGRKPGFRNAPRTVDIDILFYDNLMVNTRALTIPHPRLTERAFVLAPLAEICPEMVHPTHGKSIMELFRGVEKKEGVRIWIASGDN
jgi:2-amino-4-hydroxy-6-hydroxymethyldihydropteridine diphosphokinase